MERAARSLEKLKCSGQISMEEVARAAWPAAIGKRLAARTAAVALVRDRLVIEVEDAIWQKQLFHMREQILHRLREVLGGTLVGELEFRVAPRRRPPQTAVQARPSPDGKAGDEADLIGDPVLRHVYRQARKKASA